jgi:hypothetical protein
MFAAGAERFSQLTAYQTVTAWHVTHFLNKEKKILWRDSVSTLFFTILLKKHDKT